MRIGMAGPEIYNQLHRNTDDFFHSHTIHFFIGESQYILEYVLVFVSGAQIIPPGRFGKQDSIEFLHT